MSLNSLTTGGGIVREHAFGVDAEKVIQTLLQVVNKQDKSQFPRYIADFLAVPVDTPGGYSVRFFVCLSLKQIKIDVGQMDLEEKRPGEYNGYFILRALDEGKAEIDAIFHSLHPSRFPATGTYPETPDQHIDVAFRRFAWGRDLLPVLWNTMIKDLNNQPAASGVEGGQPAPAVGNIGKANDEDAETQQIHERILARGKRVSPKQIEIEKNRTVIEQNPNLTDDMLAGMIQRDPRTVRRLRTGK